MFNRKPKVPLTPEEELAKFQAKEQRTLKLNKIANRVMLTAAGGFLVFEGARRGAIQGAGDFTKALIEEIETFKSSENTTTSE